MKTLRQDIRVSFNYAVHFTERLFAVDNPLLREVVASSGELPRKVLVVADRGVCRHHPRLLRDIQTYARQYPEVITLAGPPLVVEGGEGAKNDPRHLSRLHRAMQAAGLCRHSFVAAVGGGAVLDLAGFAAATAHRGVRLIRVHTTVLAQADSAVGVKNGVNACGQKNFAGTFAPPWAVLNDRRFLTTLSSQDWIGGTAEAVKVALIKDADFFAFLEEHAAALAARDLDLMAQVIHRSAALHLDHIATGGDPFEFGSSRPLDFGHWAAHKLEQLSGYTLGHGAAVAVGLALDATYSHLAGLLLGEDWLRLLALLSRLGFDLAPPELAAGPRLLEGLQEFREHLGGRLTIMLLWGIGQGLEVHEMDPDLVLAAAALLKRRFHNLETDLCRSKKTASSI